MARKKPYQRPSENTSDDLADLETIGYNNDTSISDLNDIAARSKKISGTQVAAKILLTNIEILQGKKRKKKKKKDLADAETIDYNNDTNISDMNEPPSKNAKEISDWRNAEIYQRKKHLFH